MKKIFAIMLALAMILTLFAGCGSEAKPAASAADTSSAVAEAPAADDEAEAEEAEEEEEDEDEESAAEEASAEEEDEEEYTVSYPITEEPMTLSIYWQFHNFLTMFNVTPDVIASVPTFKALEEATGISLEFTLIGEENYGDSLQLMWASGDYRDFIVGGERHYTGGIDKAVEEEILLDIAPYLKEHAPDYNRILKDNPDFRTELTSPEGHIVSFSEYCEYVDSGTAIRMDWVRQLGMEAPETMDDVMTVARAFRDELGIRNPVMWNADLATFFGWNAFGVCGPDISDLGWQIADDGKTVVPSLTLDGYKECLTWMHDAFDEGLCTDDFMNVLNIAFDEYVYANETGMFYCNSNGLAGGGAERSGQPDFDLRAIPDPMKVAGEPNKLAKTTGGVGAEAISVSALTEYPEECCEFMNWIYTEDGILVSNYGVEGEAFEYDENGVPQYTDMILKAEGMPPFVATFLHTSLVGTPYYNTTQRKIASFTTEAEKECIDVWATGRTGESRYQGKMTISESEEYTQIASDIITASSEQALRFVTGGRSLDEYDTFLAEMETMGLSRITELKQAAYDRYLEANQ